MEYIDYRIDNFLYENFKLTDKIIGLRFLLKIKKLINLNCPADELIKFLYEIEFILNSQRNDRDNISLIREYIDLLEKDRPDVLSNKISVDMNEYIYELQAGLIVNNLYINQKNNELKIKKPSEEIENIEITFDDVLDSREKINHKQYILMKKIK